MNTSYPRREDTDALVPAAGAGERLGRGPKGLLELGGRPLALWAAEAVQPLVRRVIIALPRGVRPDARFHGFDVIEGAASRQATVAALVARSDARYVMTHDATRPFASRRLLAAVLDAVRETGLATAATVPAMPVLLAAGNRAASALNRIDVRLCQSPQAFDRERLAAALDAATRSGITRQACTELFDLRSADLRLVPGEETNIKITTDADWRVATTTLLPLFREPGVPAGPCEE